MRHYRAPLRDMRFVLHELHGIDAFRKMSGGADLLPDLADSILDEAAKFSESVLAPINRSGDEEGCRFENGSVRTPYGFREAYCAFAKGGWLSLAGSPQYGGQGLPIGLRTLVEEMVCSANLAFASYTNLIQGAYALIRANASEELRDIYLPPLVSGAWAATMCLTEAQAGSDLSLLRSQATPLGDGRYSMSGQKIFISAGEHDLTDNIVHLVLARLPGPPIAISLFLVPKLLPDAQGRATIANNIRCSGIEDKMGQKASATCGLSFEGAIGWLVGEPHHGLHAMFTMMNAARLGAGIQGLGIAEAAYQDAVAYARERRQGRSLGKPLEPPVPIIEHPDVRRMLLIMRAYVEGMRALAQWIAQALDLREAHPESTTRANADSFVSLMTPICKATFSDLGVECAQLGIQILGGAGYIRGHGMEQRLRDVRVTQIYDGTNGIQALDLVLRKIGRYRLALRFFEPVQDFLQARRRQDGLMEFLEPFIESLARLQAATDLIERMLHASPERAAAVASDYLRLFGLVALGFMWVRMAALALPKAGGDEGAFYRAKLTTARFYLQRLLPASGVLADLVRSRDNSVMTFADGDF